MIVSIGVMELSSVSQGILVCDTMLKSAAVELVVSRTVCSGKYIVIVSGEVGAVQSAVQAGETAADFAYIDSIQIPNIHPDIIPALKCLNTIDAPDALGVVESFSVSALIEAADVAAKAALVQLIEVRLAMALGGKAFFTCTGAVADVTASVEAAADYLKTKGALVNKIVIPRPLPQTYYELI